MGNVKMRWETLYMNDGVKIKCKIFITFNIVNNMQKNWILNKIIVKIIQLI